MCIILWISAIISSFLDNIPFIATLIPLILTMESQGMNVMPLWFATSLGACLGGKGTLIGASTNVVLANIGEKHGYDIYFKKDLNKFKNTTKLDDFNEFLNLNKKHLETNISFKMFFIF